MTKLIAILLLLAAPNLWASPTLVADPQVEVCSIPFAPPSLMPMNRLGIEIGHIQMLREHCIATKTLMIVREANPMSLRYHRAEGYRSKPVQVKLKTLNIHSPFAGLVGRPSNPSLFELDNIAALESEGWYFDDDNLLRDPNGRLIYSDYDLQGIYRRRRGGYIEPYIVDAVRQANHALNIRMLRHGPNDVFFVERPSRLRPWRAPVMGRYPNRDEKFLVISETGEISEISSTDKLREFYQQKNLPWRYTQRTNSDE